MEDNKTNQTKTPSVTSQSTFVGGNFKGHTKRAKLNLAIIVLVLAACAGGYFYYRHHQNSANSTQPYSYAYKNLETFKLPGASAGQGLSFELPTEYINGPKDQFANPTQHTFLDTQQAKGSSTTAKLPPAIGLAYASTSAFPPNPPANFTQLINPSLKDPTSAAYKSAVYQINLLIKLKYRPFQVTINKVSPFTNANIKSNAWLFDFSVTSTVSKADQAKGRQPLKLTGQLVHAVGKSSDYHFMIDSVDYNWTKNQDTWNKVLASLKVDG